MMSIPLLEVHTRPLLARDRRGGGERMLLEALRLSVAAGEVVGLLGPNGAGKSTLLRQIAGQQGAAQVLVNGQDLAGLSATARARQLAYLPQSSELHWPVAVAEVVALGRVPHRSGRGLTSADRQAIAQAMAATSVSDLARRPITSLSGGEKARVLLARALAVEAPVLLADEPIAHLDPGHQLQVLTLLRQLAGQGMAVLVVLHDLGLAARWCDRVVVLHHGALVADGPPTHCLDDGLLARVYGIAATRGLRDGAPYLVPWEAVRR